MATKVPEARTPGPGQTFRPCTIVFPLGGKEDEIAQQPPFVVKVDDGTTCTVLTRTRGELDIPSNYLRATM